MGVPMIAGSRTIGVLALEHEEPHFYTAHHARLALALASHVAVGIENARLFRSEQRRAEQLRAIAEVSQEISSFLAVETLANQAAYLIQQTFGYYHVHIGLIEGDEVIFRPSAGVWRAERACHYCEKHRFLVGQVGAAGRVASTGEPILVRDVRQDARYLPMDEKQHGSALVLPLKVRGQNIGVLNIESDDVGGFSEDDIEVLQPLANQVAVALENARLYQQAQVLAALQERQKLARELHDSVSQALYGIGLGTQTALTLARSEHTETGKLIPPLEYVHSLATTGLAEMRALIFELRPESLAVEGLVPALERRLRVLGERHELRVETDLVEPELPVASKEVLYRVAQEALHNVVKHANAGRVAVSLTDHRGSVVLEVADDGAGFDPQAAFPGHLGLQSMRERLQNAGGHLTIESEHGQGTTVRAVLTTRGSQGAGEA
jgi:signal transduction histidine kinase